MVDALSITADEARRALGAVLRAHRDAQQRRLSDVAAEAGCSPAYLSEIERGRKDVSMELLIAVAYALGVEPAGVFDELAEALRAVRGTASWPADPRRRLEAASAVLDDRSVAAVAQFSAFLAQERRAPRRIGFVPPSAGPR